MTQQANAASGAAAPETLRVNAMPAPTWSWLKMNDAALPVPQGLKDAQMNVALELDGVEFGAPHALDRALAGAAERFAHLRRASAPGDAADRARVADADDEALDVPALSAYQEGAVALEEDYTPQRACVTGMGPEALAYLRRRQPVITLLAQTPADAASTATIRVAGELGRRCVAATDVIVADGAALDLVIALDGASEAGVAGAAGETPESCGLVGSSLRLLAGRGSRVRITCVQTADDAFTALDDTGLFLDEDARVSVRHVVLGAGASYTGLAAELAGDRSRIDLDTSYLGARTQTRDFNYAIRHRGRATESDLEANGVLAGSSAKCLRGTIDLTHGCKGSSGSEHETVLLADDRVDNKTVPVILCDEDDVAGNHGATIGHIQPEQLFYLQARGISADEAEGLFIRAKLEDAALSAPDDEIRASVIRLGSAAFADFAETLEEEVA